MESEERPVNRKEDLVVSWHWLYILDLFDRPLLRLLRDRVRIRDCKKSTVESEVRLVTHMILKSRLGNSHNNDHVIIFILELIHNCTNRLQFECNLRMIFDLSLQYSYSTLILAGFCPLPTMETLVLLLIPLESSLPILSLLSTVAIAVCVAGETTTAAAAEGGGGGG